MCPANAIDNGAGACVPDCNIILRGSFFDGDTVACVCPANRRDNGAGACVQLVVQQPQRSNDRDDDDDEEVIASSISLTGQSILPDLSTNPLERNAAVAEEVRQEMIADFWADLQELLDLLANFGI